MKWILPNQMKILIWRPQISKLKMKSSEFRSQFNNMQLMKWGPCSIRQGPSFPSYAGRTRDSAASGRKAGFAGKLPRSQPSQSLVAAASSQLSPLYMPRDVFFQHSVHSPWDRVVEQEVDYKAHGPNVNFHTIPAQLDFGGLICPCAHATGKQSRWNLNGATHVAQFGCEWRVERGHQNILRLDISMCNALQVHPRQSP